MNKQSKPKQPVSFFSKWFPKIFPLIILTALLSFTWRNIPKMMLVSEGYQWFINYWQLTFFNGTPLKFNETLSAILGRIFSNLYGLNMELYHWSMLAIILILAILIYLTIVTVTKNKYIAFAASLIAISNYFGFFSILTSQYTYFIDRVVNLLLMFPSFLFLHLFLERKRKLHLFLSLLLYTLGIYVARWDLLLTELYFFYLFFWWIFNSKKNLRTLLLHLSVILLFLSIAVFFTINSPRRGNTSYSGTEFLLNPQTYRYPEKIMRQIVYWSQYPSLLEGVKTKIGNKNQIYYKYEPVVYLQSKGSTTLFLPVGIIYLLAILLVYFRLPGQRAFLFTTIFTGLTTLYFNAFLGVYAIDSQAGTHRYLNLPTYFLAIFWALVMGAAFWNTKNPKKILLLSGVAVLSIYYLINSWLISRHFVWYFQHQTPIYKVSTYITEKGSTFKEGTLVVTPRELIDGWATGFFSDQFRKNGVKFTPDLEKNLDDGDWRKIASSSAFVVRLHFSEQCQCVKEEIIK